MTTTHHDVTQKHLAEMRGLLALHDQPPGALFAAARVEALDRIDGALDAITTLAEQLPASTHADAIASVAELARALIAREREALQ